MEFNAREVSNKWKEELRLEVESFETTPTMAVIVAKGFYPPSTKYINNKIKTNEEIKCDTKVFEIEWESRTTEDIYNELYCLVAALNVDENINGIIIQRPFVDFTEEDLDMITSVKDIDGLGVFQQGLLTSKSKEAYIPATALGCVKSIQSHFGKDLSGLTITIANRSALIGVPLQTVLRNLNATVVNLHTRSDKEFADYMMKHSDIVITATGNRAIYTSDNFNRNVKMIIDCSMDRKEGYLGVGDLLKEDILLNMPETIVSSGYNQTGMMTCVGLAANCVRAYKIINNII